MTHGPTLRLFARGCGYNSRILSVELFELKIRRTMHKRGRGSGLFSGARSGFLSQSSPRQGLVGKAFWRAMALAMWIWSGFKKEKKEKKGGQVFIFHLTYYRISFISP